MEWMRLRHKSNYTIETLTRVQNDLGNTRGRGRGGLGAPGQLAALVVAAR
jgi:hypothetical protein